MTPLLPILLAAAVSESAPIPAAPADSDDVVLKALSDELKRFQTLKVDSLAPAYYIQAYVDDFALFDVAASFGALTSKGDSSHRTLVVTTRVGAPTLDNSGFLDRETYFASFMPGGEAVSMPLDADYDAIRQAVWLQLDTKYKSAVETLSRKRAYLETNDVGERPSDFSTTTTVTSLTQPRVSLTVDRDRWTKLVKEASAVFRDAPGVYFGNAHFSGMAANQCFVSTDPARDRIGDTSAELELLATTQAPDGMYVAAHYQVRGRAESDLPSDAEVVKAAHALVDRLDALAKAPVLPEDYEGPVLFTGDAAARFFLETIGSPLSHPRSPLGMPHGARLVDRLGKQIASPLLTVRDDPTLRSWQGHPLLGAYPVDDEGVVPQPITLVEKGVLKSYYMGRTPTKDLQASNGHVRASSGMPGNLIVEAKGGKSRAALKRQLLGLLKSSGGDYGLIIGELEQAENMPFAGFSMPGQGDVTLSAPTVAWRVFPDGREELVRGARFKPVSFRVLNDIVAMGKDRVVYHSREHGNDVSVVAPAVLVKSIELQKPTNEPEKPPVTPRPTLAQGR